MKRIYKGTIDNEFIMKKVEFSTKSKDVFINSIPLTHRTPQKKNIWPARSDDFESSISGQEMKWFKGSRNRGVR